MSQIDPSARMAMDWVAGTSPAARAAAEVVLGWTFVSGEIDEDLVPKP